MNHLQQSLTPNMNQFLRFENVSFTYPSMLSPLLENINVHFMPGWTGIIGANGAGKTTLLKLASGELSPSGGKIHQLGTSYYVVQRTDTPPDEWQSFIQADDYEADDIKRSLNIQASWLNRWEKLSHGERKRAQIAVALWTAPDVLALDEPTNHIDSDARHTLMDALRRFNGVGLLVSHDRELLDALCEQCLFLFPPNATMRPGGVTEGMEQDRLEQDAAHDKYYSARNAAWRLKAAAQNRRETAEQAAAKSKNAKNKKAPLHDHDGRFDRRLAKLTGKDSWGLQQSSKLASRAGKAENNLDELHDSFRKEYRMGIWLENSSCSTRNFVISVPAGELPLGDGRRLVYPELRVAPTDRVAITGPNGFGKSTLVRHLLTHVNVPEERLVSIPQEITAEESRTILRKVSLLPNDEKGNIMTIVSCLGSRPDRLLESEQSSPGEIRKILLAMGIHASPHLIVMDEPTNHMDLPSIQCLEDALADCPCAMLLVSHDETFLQKLASRRWQLVPGSQPQTIELAISTL